MSRLLELSLEPSDAFLALLRLKAASEAGRWPAQLSGRFRAGMEREFAAVEATVRALGVCYQDLEDRRIANIDRVAHSRFGDIDGAMHSGAYAIRVVVDLDHLKVALERGDPATRASMCTLATSLRLVLWYAVRTDLLLCTQLQRSGEDITPDAALRFVDGYLVSAWKGGDPPVPPVPSPEIASMPVTVGAFHTPMPLMGDGSLPMQESTAVFNAENLGAFEPDYLHAETGISQGALTTTEMDRLSYSPAELERYAALRSSGMEPESAHPTPRPFALRTRRSAAVPSLATMDPTAMPTLSTSMSNLLSEDAQFFLAQSGARWPCEPAELDNAHATLSERLRAASPTDAVRAEWLRRVERGYDELRRWTR